MNSAINDSTSELPWRSTNEDVPAVGVESIARAALKEK